MFFRFKYLALLFGLTLLLAGCSDDEDGPSEPTETGPEKMEFEKVFDVSDLPDDLYRKQLDKVISAGEDTYIVVSFAQVVKIENGEAKIIETSVSDIANTADGMIYGIGRDPQVSSWKAVYYSTDEGDSFDYISKPLMDAGVNTYQRYPNKILARKLNDGSYLMILMRAYESTSEGYTLHTDYYLESQDGINWEYRDGKDPSNKHYEAMAIDDDGKVFYKVYEKNAYFGTDIILYRSDDKGRTAERVENVTTTKGSRIPMAVDHSGQLWSYKSRNTDEDEYNISKWDGSKWVDYKSYSGGQALAGSIMDFTDDNKIVYATFDGIYVER